MIDAADLELILERIEGKEFKETNAEVADTIWQVICDTVNDTGHSRSAGPVIDDAWEKLYGPAMRHGILRRLADKCREQEEGWHTVFCNNVREVSESHD